MNIPENVTVNISENTQATAPDMYTDKTLNTQGAANTLIHTDMAGNSETSLQTGTVASANASTHTDPAAFTSHNTPNTQPDNLYRDSSCIIVSKIAYLIGVPTHIFEREPEPPRLDIYNELEKNKAAGIVRHLCIARTKIEQNFKLINEAVNYEYKPLFAAVDKYIPLESASFLMAEGISIVKKGSARTTDVIFEINRLITDRINNCKELFDYWINWDYLRELFIMPNGLNEAGTKEAANKYYQNKTLYPYQMYINWEPVDEGNILYNDKKFISLLYKWHNDTFSEYSKISDVKEYVKGNIYDFIEHSSKTVIVVDCENSDPYRLYAAIKNLDDEYLSKISSIILFDDVHTVSAWGYLDGYINIPVERLVVERVKEQKSLVDMKLALRVSQEHFANNVDSFILASSDSDYWALISSLSDANFLVLLERENVSTDLKIKLSESGIFYCYINDFYSGNADDIKQQAIFREMRTYLNNNFRLNIDDMLNYALYQSRVHMSDAEKKQFSSKYIKNMGISIDDEGNVNFEFKKK